MKKWMTYWAIALICVATQVSALEPSYNHTPFNGLYFGGNIGVGTYFSHAKDLDSFLNGDIKWKDTDTNIVGGAQIGFDVQNSNTVFGIIADWNTADLGKKIHKHSNETHSLEANLNWYSTFRARAGVTCGNALVFITGGAVVTQFEADWKNIDKFLKNRHARWGWTAGAGTEFFCGNNISIGADVLFMQFCERKYSFIDREMARFKFGHHDSAIVGRFFVNYRFSDLCSAW